MTGVRSFFDTLWRIARIGLERVHCALQIHGHRWLPVNYGKRSLNNGVSGFQDTVEEIAEKFLLKTAVIGTDENYFHLL